MSMQADEERIAIPDIAADPFDLIGIDVRHCDLYRVRQVQDHLVPRSRFPHLHDRLGDLFREPDFCGTKTFRRILEHHFRALKPWEALLDKLCAADRHAHDFLFRHAENHSPLRRRRRIIHVDDDFSGADQ